MTTTNSLHKGLVCLCLFAGCQPGVEAAGRVDDSRPPEATEPVSQPELGLPSSGTDDHCGEKRSIDLATWAALADAIIVGTVSDVALNTDIVFSGLPYVRVDWSQCDQRSVSASLRVSLSGARSLVNGEEMPAEMSFIVPEWMVASWQPRPYWSATEGELLWGPADGEVLGPGLEIGAALVWDDVYQVWSTRMVGSLFEVEPDSSLIFPESNCIATPPEFEGRTLSEFESELAAAGEPDLDALSGFQNELHPDDELWRGYAHLSTHCQLTNPAPHTGYGADCAVDQDCGDSSLRCFENFCVD